MCKRESRFGDYCAFHAKAHRNLVANYEQWKKALDISWKEYLREIAQNSFTGEWAKEVAQHLLLRGERPNVQEREEKRF
jgi:hypothetical protein